MQQPLRNSEINQQNEYHIGLGKEFVDLPETELTKIPRSRQDIHRFWNHERQRKQEIAEKYAKLNLTVQEKKTYTKPDRSGAIKKIYEAAANYHLGASNLLIGLVQGKMQLAKQIHTKIVLLFNKLQL
eukprot:TRINITY_DN13932_c0_g1_i1.p3 TRINITY_DN13932_c0_g1~~TRINITY_DN13932_c0_g1_i1.p3  ORF type:complete len:128 (-),score=14.30 TRINITY_DN13932_c0_g1_i1:234-617(-)